MEGIARARRVGSSRTRSNITCVARFRPDLCYTDHAPALCSKTPEEVSGLSGVEAIAVGAAHSLLPVGGDG